MIEILLLSFLLALTGALAPGPLLTFTIYKSLNKDKGYLAGFLIILGHAALEFAFIVTLLAGSYFFIRNIFVLTIIGVGGGMLLVLFGLLTIRSLYKNPVETDLQSMDPKDLQSMDPEDMNGFKGNSFLGGILVSLSNPYWIFWWVVVGLSFMINFNINFENPIGILLFFVGHELGDLAIYVPISFFVFQGGKSLNPKIYKHVLIVCCIFMIVFGMYLAINIVIFPPEI